MRHYFLTYINHQGWPIDIGGPYTQEEAKAVNIDNDMAGVFMRWEDYKPITIDPEKKVYQGTMYFFRDAGFTTAVRYALDRWKEKYPEKKRCILKTRLDYCARRHSLRTHDGLRVDFEPGPVAPFCLMVGEYINA